MAVVILPAKRSFLGDMMEGAQTMLPYVMRERENAKNMEAQSALAKLTRDQNQLQFEAQQAGKEREFEHKKAMDEISHTLEQQRLDDANAQNKATNKRSDADVKRTELYAGVKYVSHLISIAPSPEQAEALRVQLVGTVNDNLDSFGLANKLPADTKMEQVELMTKDRYQSELLQKAQAAQ